MKIYPRQDSIPNCELPRRRHLARRSTRAGSLRGRSVGKIATGVGAFLKDVDRFDYLEFGMTAKDAQLMPLSTRKLLELSFLSLQDSGIDYRGKNIGCYMAGVAHDIFAVSGHVSDTRMQWSFLGAYPRVLG